MIDLKGMVEMALFGRKSGRDDKGVPATEAIAKRAPHALARLSEDFTIGALETALLKDFPAEDAEEWDRTGLLVGEPALPVRKMALALDPTVAAIEEAASRGANVLITHHPAYLGAPDDFRPALSAALSSGAAVWAAVRNQVALMCFHTALDVSLRAARVLPGMLGLSFKGQFVEQAGSSQRRGYGQICDVPPVDDAPETLGRLASRCTAVFGRQPRVWGDFSKPVRRAATATGSAGTLGRSCLALDIDCLVCGEIKYHEALDVSQAGLGVIELGHDVSELPLVAVLADAVVRLGVPQDKIVVLDQGGNWAYPEAVRV